MGFALDDLRDGIRSAGVGTGFYAGADGLEVELDEVRAITLSCERVSWW